jgi:hypothetical protein
MSCVARLEASRRAWMPSPPAEPSVLVLWHNQLTQRFCVKPPQTPQTWCSLHAKLLLTWPPHRPGLVLVLCPNQQTIVLGFVEQPRNPTVFLWTNEDPACNAQPHLTKHRARQTFCLQLPDGLLGLAPYNYLAATLHRLRVHDFVLLLLPLCGPHLIPPATRSLEPSLLVYPLLGGHTGIDLSCLPRKSSCNLQLQYSAKSQSTQCSQPVITSALTTHH